MESRQIDLLNIGLIAVSLIAAFWLPFELFLFSYAVLGPLHYMTEISWLDERKYFSQSRYTPWVLGGLMLLLCIASFYMEGLRNESIMGFRKAIEGSGFKGFVDFLALHYAHILFLSFVIAVAYTAFKNVAYRLLVVAIGMGVALLFNGNYKYKLLAGTMLPTVIHVCVFTGLFMLYGAVKSKSKPGFLAFAVFLAAPVLIFFWPLEAKSYFLAETGGLTDRFILSGFPNIMGQLVSLLGMKPANANFVINTDIGIRMGIFFAFIYTYHYLNWFSKTSVIGWHKVSRKKLVGAVVIWIISIALYAYNYRVGLLSLLFLSLLHVVLEFPLNYITIKGLFSSLKQPSNSIK